MTFQGLGAIQKQGKDCIIATLEWDTQGPEEALFQNRPSYRVPWKKLESQDRVPDSKGTAARVQRLIFCCVPDWKL